MIEVLTPPQTTDLTTLARVLADMGASGVDDVRDERLATMIDDVSRMIADELERPLTRQRVRERVGTTGRPTALVSLRPIASLDTLTVEGGGEQVIGGFEGARIEDRGAGIIWCRTFGDDSARTLDLVVDRRPWPGLEPWTVTYQAGWLTRADDIMASGITASGATLTRTSGRMPLLASGDQVLLRGWGSAANAGRFVVFARTDLEITVGGTLDVEVGGPDAKIEVRNLPASLERLALDTIRVWLDPDWDPTKKSESIGDWSASWGGVGMDRSLPAHVIAGLEQWRPLA